MTTHVSFFVPYIMSGKAVRIRTTNPQHSSEMPPISETVVTERNVVHSVVIHDHAMLEIAEIDAPAEEG